MKKTILYIVLAMLWPVLNGFGQQIPTAESHLTISGRVTDEQGQVLPGTAVKVKNSEILAITDNAGKFRLAGVPVNSIIVISFIGYLSTEIPAGDLLGAPDIALKPDPRLLQEVVVSTGYQEIPLERATGSFASVNNELFNRQVSPDVMSRLKGIAPSLLFDERSGSPKLSIRGRSTIFANDRPLIVLDNFPYDGDINNINPNDVAEISILRDAAAASIWGARAGNGVIVITTKKGHANQPLTVQLNSNITLSNKPDLFYQPIGSTADFIDTEIMLYERGFFNADINNTTTRPPVSPVVELLELKRIGQLADSDLQLRLNELRSLDVRNDILKHIYQTGFNSQNALNIRGGGEVYNYYYSAGLDFIDPNLRKSGSTRMTISSRQNFNPFRNLDINLGIDYSKSNSQSNNLVQDLITGGPSGKVIYPYTRFVDDDGNPAAMVKDYRNSFKDMAVTNGRLNWDFVPLDELNLLNNNNRISDIRLQSGIKYNLSKSLDVALRYFFDEQLSNSENIYSQDSYFARNLINRYTSASGQTLTRNIPVGDLLSRGENRLQTHNGRLQLGYDKEWKQHALTGIAGFDVRQVRGTGNRNRFYGYSPTIGSTLPVNTSTSFSLYPSGSATIPAEQGISGTTDRFRSYFGNLAYTYKDRYTFTASGRIDQSNHFGLNPNQRAVPLWSSGFKWDVLEEKFASWEWLSDLKFKVTYGFNGNIDKSVTAFTTANITSNTLTNTPAANINNPPNPNLGWERNRIINLGVEFGTRNAWLHGNIEYYLRKGENLVGESPLDPTSGQKSFRGNVAEMKGSGVDAELNSLILNRKLKWNSNLIFSYTRDEITRYDVLPVFAGYMADGSLTGTASSYSPTPGKPLFGVYSKPWAGLDAVGDPMGYVNGQPGKNYTQLNSTLGQTVDSLVFHGRALPPVYGAFRNTFSFKGFSLSANITYRFGHFFRRSSIDYGNFYNKGISHSDFGNRWTKPGDEQHTNVPSMPLAVNAARDNFYRTASVLIESGSVIRLQDINIHYLFEKDRFRMLPVKNVALSVYINNCGILWRRNSQGIDPDFPSMTLPRTISFGLRSTL